MPDYAVWLALGVFAVTVILLITRPGGMNESVPTTIGAAVLIAVGVVRLSDLERIVNIVSGAAVTILSAIVMSIVLDSIGYFRWVANNLAYQAKGSGYRLYWLIVLLCFLMTLFFNNDGSILITTPIILQLCNILQLKMHQKIPYLVSGALVATASSAPIGVSNLANLIALHIVGLDLNRYTALMFVPSLLGIGTIAALLMLFFRRDIPRKVTAFPYAPPVTGHTPYAYYSPGLLRRWIGRNDVKASRPYHPLRYDSDGQEPIDWWLFRASIAIVVLIRAGLFLAEGVGIPVEALAASGVLLLLAVRWIRTGVGVRDVFSKTPWHILLFAFSTYVIVTGLQNAGLTSFLIHFLQPFLESGHGHAVAAVGLALTVMSNLVNNLPSVMIGTLALTEMGLDGQTLQLAYLANIIGSDIGALLTPMGTLASLIWMFLLGKNKIAFTWRQYMRTTIVVIPIALLVSLCSLYGWAKWIA